MEAQAGTTKIRGGRTHQLPSIRVDHLSYEGSTLDIGVLVPRIGDHNHGEGDQYASQEAVKEMVHHGP